MRTLKKSLFIATLSTLFVGCMPHLNLQQCQSMNWNDVGYEDGSKGHFQRNLNRAITDCAKFELSVNTRAYEKGWRSGTRTFCKPSKAFDLGTQGKTYHHICPAKLAAPFERSWKQGIKQFCVPTNGYNLGRSGQSCPNFCPAPQATEFRNAYDAGHRINQLTHQRDHLEHQLIKKNGWR